MKNYQFTNKYSDILTLLSKEENFKKTFEVQIWKLKFINIHVQQPECNMIAWSIMWY